MTDEPGPLFYRRCRKCDLYLAENEYESGLCWWCETGTEKPARLTPAPP